jgi:hypothetical protein
VTSHSSQGQTADRVLIHADTQLGAKDLLNNRMAYVAVSHGAYDAQRDRQRCLSQRPEQSAQGLSGLSALRIRLCIAFSGVDGDAF